MQLTIQPHHHGRPIGYRYGCRCWACASAHATAMQRWRDGRGYSTKGPNKDEHVRESANMTMLEMIASLPVGVPHVPGPHERGEIDGYHGRVPAEDSRAYLAGHALGLDYRRVRAAIERAKACREVGADVIDHHAATYSPRTGRDARAS